MQFLDRFRNFYQSLNHWQDLMFDFLVLAPLIGIIFLVSFRFGLWLVKKIFNFNFQLRLFKSNILNYLILIVIGFFISIIIGLAPWFLPWKNNYSFAYQRIQGWCKNPRHHRGGKVNDVLITTWIQDW